MAVDNFHLTGAVLIRYAKTMHLSEFMAERNLSDEEVASAIGCHRVTVNRYRRGVKRPDWDAIQKIRIYTKELVSESDWRRKLKKAA